MRKIIPFSAILLLLTTTCKRNDTKPAEEETTTTNNNQPTVTNTVSDIDGNTYKIVTIGTQTWMAENLRVTKYNDGTAITNVSDSITWSGLTTGAYSWYRNDQKTYMAKYGALYNWHAVNSAKLCPKGWHVATDEEWITLETYLAKNGYNYDGTSSTTNVRDNIAKALADSSGWNSSSGTGAVGNKDYSKYRNKSGFKGLPGGFRADNGSFVFVGEYSVWWSATEENPNCAWYRDITYNNPLVDRAFGFKKNGFSVRCVKD